LIPRKGIDSLFVAFKKLIKIHKEAKLLLIGDGPTRKRVRDFSKENLSHFKWIFSVPYEKIPLYYFLSDYFVFPTYFDDWGNVVNESHCAKLPIICSDGAHASFDLIKHGKSGLIYKAGDVNTLVELMEYAIEHPLEMEKMAQNGYSFIQSDWNQKESVEMWCKYVQVVIEEGER